MIEYQSGNKITDKPAFVRLHQEFWKTGVEGHEFDYTHKDVLDLEKKLKYVGDGFAAGRLNGSTAVVLESALVRTEGNPDMIPRTNDELTRSNTWSSYDIMEGDTRIFTTFSVDPSMRKIAGNGHVRTADEALDYFLSHYKENYAITFSPATERAQRLHRRHGAESLLYLPDARPGLVIAGEPAENVVIMAYRWPMRKQVYVPEQVSTR